MSVINASKSFEDAKHKAIWQRLDALLRSGEQAVEADPWPALGAVAAENHRLHRVLRDVYDALAPCFYSDESILEPMPLSEFMDRNNAALEIINRAGLRY